MERIEPELKEMFKAYKSKVKIGLKKHSYLETEYLKILGDAQDKMWSRRAENVLHMRLASRRVRFTSGAGKRLSEKRERPKATLKRSKYWALFFIERLEIYRQISKHVYGKI